MLKVPDKNTERLLGLAAYFETLDPKRYNQRRFHDADTGAMCICGHANTRAGYQADDVNRACDVLGISREIADKLFAAGAGRRYSMWSGHFKDPTPKDAARVLRHLAVTGELPAAWATGAVENMECIEA